MPPRSAIYCLDCHVRRELDRRIVESDFGDWRKHVDWLAEMGFTFSQDIVRRYGMGLRSDPIRLAFILSERVGCR